MSAKFDLCAHATTIQEKRRLGCPEAASCDPGWLEHQKARLRQGQVMPKGGKTIEQAIAELEAKCGKPATTPKIGGDGGGKNGGGGGGGGGVVIDGGGGGGGGISLPPPGGGGGGGSQGPLEGLGAMMEPNVSMLSGSFGVRQGIGSRMVPGVDRILAGLRRAY
jgi:hypothetical protein